MDTLKAKLFIEGDIELLTGMHIGGSSTALDIGGIDQNVIKTAAGVPYLPGSSLKGKMRNLTGKKRGCNDLDLKPEELNEHSDIALIFGLSGNVKKEGFATRLIVRDAYLAVDDFKNKKQTGVFAELELEYTDGKWENVINRLNGTAEHPRQMERVPAGAVFNFSLVYSIFNDDDRKNVKTVLEALRLLQDDYLGGSGSRGYGQVRFKNISFALKTPAKYEGDNSRISIGTWASLDGDMVALLTDIQKHLPTEATNANH
ncbi:MAG TPA: type III-A CRISPR-associated RAMP protein Csm3 [bacterium]|nr:type III-A CRISPR-associated RAMP protein Csm3 [bacterium]